MVLQKCCNRSDAASRNGGDFIGANLTSARGAVNKRGGVGHISEG